MPLEYWNPTLLWKIPRRWARLSKLPRQYCKLGSLRFTSVKQVSPNSSQYFCYSLFCFFLFFCQFSLTLGKYPCPRVIGGKPNWSHGVLFIFPEILIVMPLPICCNLRTGSLVIGTDFVSRNFPRGVEGARSSSSSGKNQLVGFEAGPAFLGGSLMSFGAGLAAFSVHHRYQRYSQLSGQKIENPAEACEIEAACPRNSLCQWGVCHCLPGFIQAWGTCLPQRDPDF